MNYQIKLLLLSFFISLVIANIVIPILRKFKIGQIEREDGPQSHLKKKGTPTMGGVITLITLLIMSVLLWIKYKEILPETIKSFILLVLVSIGFGIIGFIDDFKKLILKDTTGLKPAYKMIGLLIISVAFVIFLLQFINIGTDIIVPFLKKSINIPSYLYIPFVIFVMLGTTNAINLTDGIDGLATTVTTIIIACLTVIGIISKCTEVVFLGSIVCGANLAFLLFNMYPAKIFMGDTGSLFLGGVIASMAIYLKNPLILLIIALIPVAETLSVIIQVAYFKKTGKRILKMAPLHHHFELSGWNENKIVTVFSILTLILCIVGVYSI